MASYIWFSGELEMTFVASYLWFFGEFVMTDTYILRGVLCGLFYVVFESL